MAGRSTVPCPSTVHWACAPLSYSQMAVSRKWVVAM